MDPAPPDFDEQRLLNFFLRGGMIPLDIVDVIFLMQPLLNMRLVCKHWLHACDLVMRTCILRFGVRRVPLVSQRMLMSTYGHIRGAWTFSCARVHIIECFSHLHALIVLGDMSGARFMMAMCRDAVTRHGRDRCTRCVRFLHRCLTHSSASDKTIRKMLTLSHAPGLVTAVRVSR